MTTMQALVAYERGGPDQLRMATVPCPQPGPGEVLVEVHAAAITFAELGWLESWTHRPMIPSHEMSGVVVTCGPGVTGLAVGDQVFGLVRFDRLGAAAEYVTLPAGDLARRPPQIPHVLAATLPLAGLTGWQALHDHAGLRPHDEVLVHGGAGGVGGFAVQLAAEAGAVVTATVRGSDDALVARRLGSRRVIDVNSTAFDAGPARYDVVLDTVGGETLERSYPLLSPGGRLVTLAAPPSAEQAAKYRATATFFIVTPDRDELAELVELVDCGALQVTIAATYPLAEGRAAFESGTDPNRLAGKTVLVVRE
jgi:NADPH:quinone reductase-like Zn-dependent oxidoreductase